MTRKELIINLLTDPQDEDWHELYNDIGEMLFAVIIAGCLILSIQKYLR